MGVITFNGVTSESLGIHVSTPPNYEVAERIYETTPVPGRNGDVVMDTGAYKNVTRSYEISIGEENGKFYQLSDKIVGWLHSAPGYLRLEDTYEPDVYKLARFNGEMDIANILQQAGTATIEFDRKPQRFLKSGDNKITVNGSNLITNPTNQPSKPLIRVNGSGSGVVHIGSYSIELTNISAYVYIDCDLEEVYKDAINMSNNATLAKGWPVMVPGQNNVTHGGGISSVEVTPRWWKV